MTRAVVLAALLLAVPAAAYDQPISAFASNVGKRVEPDQPPPPVTLYEVPDGRMLLVTDVLVSNHGQEVGVVYLSDSHHTLCSVALLQSMYMSNNPTVLSTLQNPHVSFTSGIPVGPGEPLIATLDGGTRGVDITITGKLVPGPRAKRSVVLPGGAKTGTADEDTGTSP